MVVSKEIVVDIHFEDQYDSGKFKIHQINICRSKCDHLLEQEHFLDHIEDQMKRTVLSPIPIPSEQCESSFQRFT